MKTDLLGKIDNTVLGTSKFLIPIFEAISNSFQSLEDLDDRQVKYISVVIERENSTDEKAAKFSNFKIIDSGPGFNQFNYDSFITADSRYKNKKGCKGVGRFSWLKAFNEVKISSSYNENGKGFFREIEFNLYDPEKVEKSIALESKNKESKTEVKLIGFKKPFQNKCSSELEYIANRIIEHFLPYFLDSKCPKFSVEDDQTVISLNEIFEKNYKSSTTLHKFKVHGYDFTLKGVRVYNSKETNNIIIYAADSREVLSEGLDKYIPNLSKNLTDTGGNFSYVAFVESEVLNTCTDSHRTNFSFDTSKVNDTKNDEQQIDSFSEDLNLKSIRNKSIEHINLDLKGIIDAINKEKKEVIENYINQKAPQYIILRNQIDDFLNEVPRNISESNIDMFLHKKLYQKESELKKRSSKVINSSESIKDFSEYQSNLEGLIKQFTEFGKSNLAQYVAHRKIIIDLLEKSISSNADGKYPLEKQIHSLIFPMNRTSDDTLYSDQNLWVIDERLSYHGFLTSDKRLDQVNILDNTSQNKPDLLVFNQPLLFSPGGENIINSMTVIEFKRADRDDYKEDPLDQVFRMVRDVTSGVVKDRNGRPVKAASAKVPAYCYVICDITDKVKIAMENKGATPTPDNLGYFGYNPNYSSYYEVISYDKLLQDTKLRNKILFEKLGLNTNKS